MLRQLIHALVPLLACALAPSLSAQCPGPDNLSGSCWQSTQANLPGFPNQTLPATTICYDDCAPTQECARLVLDAPNFVACGQYTQTIAVDDCTTGIVMKGVMSLDYTRTWMESTPVAPFRRYQVYRFAIKVLMKAESGVAASCAVPPCSVSDDAFYYGYLDYAYDCTAATWESALMLFHNCDEYIHKTAPAGAFSPAGSFHPTRMYAIVAPSSATNPFVAAPPLPAPGGTLVAEAVRPTPLASPVGTCITEDPVVGSATFLVDACLCPLTLSILQVSARDINGFGTCTVPGVAPTKFKTLVPPGAFPWYHAHSTWIGRWTMPAAGYPGPEQVWADEAAVSYQDACYDAAGLQRKWGEMYYGATTAAGYPVTSPGLSENFIDWASNASFPLPGTPAFPIIGPVFPTRNLMYFNTP